MNRNLIIAGSFLVVGIVIYFVWKSKKKSLTNIAPQGPQPGGAFSPKTLTEEDFLKLEKIFNDGNPYNNDLVKAIEGQSQDENNPLKTDGGQKNLLTKEAFNNIVLAKIRRLIGERSPWIQDEENRRFEEWRGAVRAGYADSLAQAFAYAVRTDTAINNYYTGSTAPGSTATGSTTSSTTSSTGENINYNNMVPEMLRVLTWSPTNIGYIITAMQAGATGQRIYFDTNKYSLISATEARSKGVTI